MAINFVTFLLIAGVIQCGLSHHLRHRSNEESKLLPTSETSDVHASAVPKYRRSLQPGFYSATTSEDKIPYSYKRLDKMMKKAILQIILGDLRPADMVLLKDLNYTPEEVMTIREHELSRMKEEEEREARAKKLEAQAVLSAKYQEEAKHRRSSSHHNKVSNNNSNNNRHVNLEVLNKQAVYDYENGIATTDSKDYDESKVKVVTEESLRKMIDRAMEPHVVFKIRHDDSEFDSGSDERSKTKLKNHRTKTVAKINKARSSVDKNSFQESKPNSDFGTSPSSLYSFSSYDLNKDSEKSIDLEESNKQAVQDYENLVDSTSDNWLSITNIEDTKQMNQEFSNHEDFERALNGTGSLENVEQQYNDTKEEEDLESTTAKKRVSEYEGLEWVGADVYRVKPEAMEALLNYEDELLADLKIKGEERGVIIEKEEDGEEDDEDDTESSPRVPSTRLNYAVNDTFEYQDDAQIMNASSANGNLTDGQNLTSYQRFLLAQRQDQTYKAIEEIKLRVLAMTGRFNNLTSTSSQAQRERLTMFSPTCHMPRNTDPEAWSDPFSMNMHFQLNLTSSEHVLAAKLRLFKLPQETLVRDSGGTASTYEDDEEEEKKIRVSVYFYTKSLKKHRAKKRLMDSIVTPLTSQGSHFALDVRQGLRFWRPTVQQQQHSSGHSGNSGNHGLLVQVEDQDGRPLKPSLYIQEPRCQTETTAVTAQVDDKAYQQYPAIFIRACTRYVRLVKGKIEMYVQCKSTHRH